MLRQLPVLSFRPCPRFSLRTLFVLVTACALGCPFLKYEYAARQRELAAKARDDKLSQMLYDAFQGCVR